MPSIQQIPAPKSWTKTRGLFLRPIILESPYRGQIDRNVKYARLCFREAFLRYGDIPVASHLLYTQVLDDNNHFERHIGIQGNFVWTDLCQTVVVYTDLGFSEGMEAAILNARAKKKHVEFRNLYKPWLSLVHPRAGGERTTVKSTVSSGVVGQKDWNEFGPGGSF